MVWFISHCFSLFKTYQQTKQIYTQNNNQERSLSLLLCNSLPITFYFFLSHSAALPFITISLLTLSLSSHLLQFLPVLPFDEALLMSHLRKVICRRQEKTTTCKLENLHCNIISITCLLQCT